MKLYYVRLIEFIINTNEYDQSIYQTHQIILCFGSPSSVIYRLLQNDTTKTLALEKVNIRYSTM